MRHLILMRHGEAGFAAPSQSDFERPLTARGLNDARHQGQVLKVRHLVPDIVFCSPALRTRTTWEGLAAGLGDGLSIDFVLQRPDKLYQANKHTILELVAEADDRHDIILVLAHNPGIQEAALTLSQPAPGHDHSELSRGIQSSFSPATMAVFSHAGRSWYDTAPGLFSLETVLSPSQG